MALAPPDRAASTRVGALQGGRARRGVTVAPTLAALSCSVRAIVGTRRARDTQHDERPRPRSRRSCKNELPRCLACLAARCSSRLNQQFRACLGARQSAARPRAPPALRTPEIRSR